MGCLSSKNIAQVVPIHTELPPSAPIRASSLEKAVIPSIPTKRPSIPSIPSLKPVAFEIPLDNLTKDPLSSLSSLGSKKSLPKLHLSEQDIRDKLANSAAKWDELDQKKRRKGDKPQLTAKKIEDPEALKQRLAEKESIATQNRQREIDRLQAKLARQEAHAKRVLERKKQMGEEGQEDLKLSWGGEDGGLSKKAESKDKSLEGSSRNGSGRSNGTEHTSVDEHLRESVISV